jgi:dephospho-CoA kinase
MSRSLRVGITGLMGSGKSTFSNLLRATGHLVLESDSIAKEIMQHDAHARGEINALLGSAAYHGDQIDRAFIASQIFNDKAKRIALESIVHPRVTIAMELQFAKGVQGEVTALESALILQTELWREFDYIILIDATIESIVERLRGGRFSESEVRSRTREQTDVPIDKDEVDFTIENNGSLEDFTKRSTVIVELLSHLAQRELPPAPLHQLELQDGDEFSVN